MTELRTLEDLPLSDLRGRRILVRVDFNVPLDGDRVADDTRLVAALPTLGELSAAGGRIALVSHLGRPKGRPLPEASLRPVARRLGELMDRAIGFAEDCVGEPAREAVVRLEDGDLCLLENLRFHAGETANDDDFASRLASLAEVYVGDAFGAAHRAHASVVGVPQRLPRRAAGRLMVREVEALTRLLGEVDRPFVAVIGGAKIEGKIDVLESLLQRVDALLVGGGMANTFLAARGVEMGSSLVERERLDLARDLLQRAEARGVALHLPEDLVVADGLDAPGPVAEVAVDAGVPGHRMALDIGAATRSAYASVIARARTLFWNGPLGVFERPPFDAGTRAIAAAVGSCPGSTVIGGGETVAAVTQAGFVDRIDHVSTGGGAALELLAGRTLPGVAILAAEGDA
jgi:phosphoglycerate kinase